MKPKLVIVVMDGASDGLRSPTSLEVAKTPGLDELAKSAVCGAFYPIDDKSPPESDAAVFSLLGYNPNEYAVGRGLLEAIGAGVEFRVGEVAFRANFATVDPATMRIIDRRAGRTLTTDDAVKLAEALNGIDLGIHGGYAKVKATVGHRAVVVIGSRKFKLSADVSNIDPAYGRIGRLTVALQNFEPVIPKCKPLAETPEAVITCEIVDAFVRKAVEILDRHPVNIERESRGLLKANAILLRDAEDRMPGVKPVAELHSRVFGAVVEMPVEIGIAKLLGMKFQHVGYPTGNPAKDLPVRLDATLKLIDEVDVVYVHLKGPDEPGHDGDFEKKVRAIEDIDRYFIQPLIGSIDLDKVAVMVTADHATPPQVRAHTADIVPLMVSYRGLRRFDNIPRFTEKYCVERGSIGVIDSGFKVLRKVFKLLEA